MKIANTCLRRALVFSLGFSKNPLQVLIKASSRSRVRIRFVFLFVRGFDACGKKLKMQFALIKLKGHIIPCKNHVSSKQNEIVIVNYNL